MFTNNGKQVFESAAENKILFYFLLYVFIAGLFHSMFLKPEFNETTYCYLTIRLNEPDSASGDVPARMFLKQIESNRSAGFRY